MTTEATTSAPGRLSDAALDVLFREARSYSYWQPRPVEQSLIRELYDLLKMGPTSANTTPARFLFLTTAEAKDRLVRIMPEGNKEKTRTAPVVAIIAYDLKFFENMDRLAPGKPFKQRFAENPAEAQWIARLSGTLQGAYLIMAARSLGLDCGPMLGDLDAINAEFLPDSSWKANFVCALGYGVKERLHPRLPRLDFEEAARIL